MDYNNEKYVTIPAYRYDEMERIVKAVESGGYFAKAEIHRTTLIKGNNVYCGIGGHVEHTDVKFYVLNAEDIDKSLLHYNRQLEESRKKLVDYIMLNNISDTHKAMCSDYNSTAKELRAFKKMTVREFRRWKRNNQQ